MDKLRDAWSSTVAAHDAFGLIVDTSEPRQKFQKPEFAFSEADLSDGTGLDAWIGDFTRKGFARNAPLWELCFASGKDGELHCALRVHALVCDERSLASLAREVGDRYGGAACRDAFSFASFVRRGDGPAAADREESDAKEWQAALASPPPSTVLLGCRGPGRAVPLVSVQAALPEDRARELETFRAERSPVVSSREDALRNVLVTAAFAWINRLSGQQDIVIAIHIDRPAEDSARAVGPLDGRSYLRATIEEGETFASLASKVRTAWSFAEAHPIASIGSDFESAFAGPLPALPNDFGGIPASFRLETALTVSGAEADEAPAPDGPSISWSRKDGSLALRFDFAEAAYPRDVRDRLVRYYIRLLEGLIRTPNGSIRGVDLVDDGERDGLLSSGLGPIVPEVEDLLSVIARQTRLRPDRPAVEFRARSVSYAELDRHTNRLARRLRAVGVVTGSRVAVAMPRGFGEFMSILAVLKTGGAYVPVDPAHPIDRVRAILEDAEPQVLVVPTESPVREAFPTGVPALILDDPLTEGLDVDDGPLDLPVDPRQKAYIIFTSGSTGRPKGVEIPRGGISNFLQSVAKKPGLGPNDRLAAISTTTFDMSELDFFLPLCVGGTVVIAERAHALDPELLRGLLEDREITVMQATPTTWRMLLDAGWRGHGSFKIFTGGEPISLALARRLLGCCGELWNLYGPTETSVYSTIDRIVAEDERITVGKAIDNTLITIRDPEGRFVPRFAVGELCIGGNGLALGYYGRPDLTADRFPTDPRTGERYYRTGDLGRYLSDGRLECLGRVDFQVKVRGFRIEPSDIEAQLRTVSGVSDILVVALRRGEEDPRLVAYWVGSAKKEALHERAKEKLPYYMVPSAYVHLDAFPLTTSGKVDRKQLPDPGDAADEGAQGTAPRNDRETIVASIWKEVLGLPFVPVDEDFFSLGGTSVRILKMRTRLQEAFGVQIALKTLFEHPTVEGIVARLDSVETGDDAPIVSWLSAAKKGGVPWIGLMGIQLFDNLAQELGSEYPTLAIHVPVKYVPGVDPFPTVREIARKYVAAVKAARPEGPYYLFGLCHGGIVAFEVAAQLREAGDEVAMVVLLDAELPLARRTRPFVRLRYALRDLFADPAKMSARIAGKISVRVRGRRNAQSPEAATQCAVPVTLVADDAGIDDDLTVYQSLLRKVDCDVLTFRATRGDTVVPWIAVAPDLGWGGRAKNVRSFDIDSTHLGIVKAPYAGEIARSMNEARRGYE